MSNESYINGFVLNLENLTPMVRDSVVDDMLHPRFYRIHQAQKSQYCYMFFSDSISGGKTFEEYCEIIQSHVTKEQYLTFYLTVQATLE